MYVSQRAQRQYNVQMYIPLGSGVVALHCVSAGLALEVASDGKQEALQDGDTDSAASVPHLRDDVHHPPICLRVVALDVAQRLVL